MKRNSSFKICKFSSLCAMIAFALIFAFAFTARVSGQALPGSLWYNGDFNGVNALANESNTSSGAFSNVYDDFNVTGSSWDLTSVYSNNLINGATVMGATWEIRSGVSAGNGGTLVASGSTSTPIVTPTGRTGLGLNESTVEVTGLNVTLAPGTYWLNVTPTFDTSFVSYMTDTSGTSCVGTPCGNNDNAFWNTNIGGGQNFSNTATTIGQSDFSEGVIGTRVSAGVPDSGSTASLFALALAALVVASRLRSIRLA